MPTESVTLIIRHRVATGQVPAYESWLRRITRVASGYPGHLGVDVLRDGALFTSVLRFASAGQLQVWLDSAERAALIAEVEPLLSEGESKELHDGHEFWFVPNSRDQAPPPRWKQACITFLVIQPLTLLVPQLWQPVFERLPWLGGYVPSNVLITLSIVLSVVYLFMPRVTAWFAGWLHAR
ncbi:antibiotic biosynthesis monooxygenase [Pseudomonas alcaligenes]|uniref:Antibiotic biosynthesis monooxygenase n=1 Tax=Aquipseudomonas alcaligenes TaxID=43263 RepID=A0ABR7S2M4_AQUAC|nr:antibiotic biosynthesis monooxygenase [Pseudomonas alcaligenes]MBC9251831.1 antibiotic biosynthesis monooxygenase [Pseudomonas alcaligenes]